MQATIEAYKSAIEHCRAASESDPGWFTLDVQDSHSRRVSILRDALSALQADPMPLPEETSTTDGLVGKIFAGYARTAEVTSRLKEQPGVQNFAEKSQAALAGARCSFSSFSNRIRRSINTDSGSVPTAATSSSAASSSSGVL